MRSWARWSGPSAPQDTASAQQVYLVLRRDDRGMSRSTHVGLEPELGAGLALSSLNAPAASRYPAPAVPFPRSRHRRTLSNTMQSSIALIEREQPRFKLVVARDGIDDQELGALGDGRMGGALPNREAPSRRPSRGTASRIRLATFSSC